MAEKKIGRRLMQFKEVEVEVKNTKARGILALVFLAIGVVFFTVYLLTQYVSLASIMAAATFAIAFTVFHSDNVLVVIGAVFMGLLTIFQHRSNVKRLLKGEECRTNLFKKGKNQ